MYPEQIVTPCREELTSVGIKELRTPDEVDKALGKKNGSTLVVINSVCGCAAGGARPAVRLAMKHSTLPDRTYSVFAGVDVDAVARARSFMVGYPPSSPAIALFRDGKLVHMLERHDIEGQHPGAIAENLKKAFDIYCRKN
jgi:putative YphP/YqiW family bacilliredoxin